MHNRFNKLIDLVTSREAYLIYGVVCGMAMTALVVRTRPTQIVVVSDTIMNEILAKRGDRIVR